jgi:hypothetical protein
MIVSLKGNKLCFVRTSWFEKKSVLVFIAWFVYSNYTVTALLLTPTLLQGLTLISGTQTGCRRLDSYIEKKKFLACGPKFFVEFSAPPEFSGGVTEKCLSTVWARTINLQITKQILYHCATASLSLFSYNIYVVVARIFRPFL